MDALKQLELRRLINEFNFIKSDFVYKKELLSNIESDFISSVNTFLNKYPELEKIYNEKTTNRITIPDINLKSEEIISSDIEIDSNESQSEIGNKLRAIYRNIVKLTHPDKIQNDRLNSLYIKATEHYDRKDIISIYPICDTLGINYEIDDSEKEIISDEIKSLKNKIKFIESNPTWHWHNTNNENIKNNIIIDHIRIKIT